MTAPAPQDRTALLRFDGVSRTFAAPDGAAVEALRGIDLEIADGEFVTVVGPSGCGKSTLLNLVVGLDRPDGGRVTLHGRPAWEARRSVGYVTQEDNLFPWRTLLENVTFPLELRRMRRAEREALAADYLRRVGLAGFETRYAHQLSGGMRQRGNIVRALCFSPEVLLMDEPFGPLDAQTRITLQSLLLDLWQAEHKTVLFITHDLQEAIALGDRVVVMTARPGRIKAVHRVPIPRPRDLYHLHEDPAFRALLSRLWEELAEEVRAAGRQQETAA